MPVRSRRLDTGGLCVTCDAEVHQMANLASRGHDRATLHVDSPPLSAMREDGALIAAEGVASSRLFALGPILKGQLWETTAVRELRVQAQELARRLVALPSARWAPAGEDHAPREPRAVIVLDALDKSA